jgi:hopanoid-associated phosphorylase
VSSVLIVCGLKREAAILEGADRLAACGNAPTLQRRLAELETSEPRLVISWGVCGGLDRRLRSGDLVVGLEVTFGDESIPTDQAVASRLSQRLAAAGARVSLERFATVSAPVLTASKKAELGVATGAAAVDMESQIAGRFARRCGAPFAVLRAVADPAERDLPPLAANAIDSEGRVNPHAVVTSLLLSPGQIGQLGRLARDSRAAFLALERCRRLLPGLFLGLGRADL